MTKLNFGVDVSEKTLDLAYWDQSKQKPIFQDKFPNTKQGFQTIASRIVNGILKTADYRELIMAIYGGEKYPLMAMMDIPYEL